MVATARSSQVVSEVLNKNNRALATQVVVEVLSGHPVIPTAVARASQTVVEVLSSVATPARMTQIAEEVLAQVFTYPNPVPIYPTTNPNFSYSVHKRPTFATIVQTAVSGREVSSAQQAYPLWEFELTYEGLREQTQNQQIDSYMAPHVELEAIAGLFLIVNGQYGRFYFDDWTDDSRKGQQIGTGDGTTTLFRVVRTFGFGQAAFTEPVGGVNISQPLAVYLNGVVVPSANYSITSDNLNVQFNTAPASGAVITMDFFFYYFCRFIEDVQDYEQFMHNLWTIKAIKFRSVKV